MKRWSWSLVLFASLGLAPYAAAQQPILMEPKPSDSMAGPSHAMTPEMWMYLHEERRADDPATAVRRRAELKAAQREQRLMAQRWYGFYNARPQAGVVPIMGSYSPTWVGNGWNTNQWLPSNSYTRVERVEVRR